MTAITDDLDLFVVEEPADGAVRPDEAPLPVMTPDTLAPATAPTLYFIGVTTGQSSIQRVFPRWAEELGLDGGRLQGIDLPIGAPATDYQRVVDFIAADPLVRGAQVTTHKIDLLRAAAGNFDELGPLATLMGEVSCIGKQDGRLLGYAKDPICSSLAIDAFIPPRHWQETDGQVLLLGAGGAGSAITWSLTRTERGADRPSSITVADRSAERLEHLAEQHRSAGSGIPLVTALVSGTEDADALLAAMPADSLIVNATGLGKDLPGSPISDAAVFPDRALAWDLNYRGDLVFLAQALGQTEQRALTVEDGWTYFVHGWLQALGQVFGVRVPTGGPELQRFADLAASAR